MEAITIAIIGVLGIVLGGLLTNHFLRPKLKAETEKLASDIWKELANKMESRVLTLEETVKKQEIKITRYGKRIIYLTNGIEILVNQIITEGKQPCWTPDEWNPEE